MDANAVMVLDSADDPDVFGAGSNPKRRPLAAYLPQSPNGFLLVTTRDKDLASRLVGGYKNTIKIGPMAQSDALLLLEKKLGSLSDTDMAVNLARALDLVPLAISQAAAYIQRMSLRSSPKKYLDEFRKSERNRRKLLQYDGGDLRRDGGASNAILTTWQISFEYIRSKQPSAANLLSLMSFFDRQGILGWVLNPSRIAQDGDVSFEDDVAMLRDYCLITADETEDKFEMHGLVQLSTRMWLETFGQDETFRQQYIERMAALFPPGQFENWSICRTLFAHARVTLDYQPSENTVESWAIVLHNGGWYAWSQGKYEDAQQMLGKAREVRERRLGTDDMTTLSSTSLLASVFRDRGLWKEAEKLFVQVMETRKAKLGADHPSTLTSMANLASTFWNQGRWEEAEKLEVQVMETSKAKLGADHPLTLTSMNNLAFTWKSQGRHEDALPLMQDCVEARERVLGPEHPDTLSSLATILEWSGYHEARRKVGGSLNMRSYSRRERKGAVCEFW